MKAIFTIIRNAAIIIMLMSFPFHESKAWGREGHEVIATMAENHLNPKSRKIIEKYLGNHSIVYYAKWMDDFRHTPEYKFTHGWHTVLVDDSFNCVPRENGDALHALESAMDLLRDYKNLPDSTVAVNIKYVLHLVADLHCPAHIYYQGRPIDFKVMFGGNYIGPMTEVSMHAVWDKLAIQSCRIWSVSEYARQIDRVTRQDAREISRGTPREWLRENARRCSKRQNMISEGDVLSQDFINETMPFIEYQMLLAGYRLATVLNQLF